jgi:hypothetical protein
VKKGSLVGRRNGRGGMGMEGLVVGREIPFARGVTTPSSTRGRRRGR